MTNLVEIEQDEIEHKIKIDSHIEMRLKIPEELDALEFNSILEKARKMLRLGEIVITPDGKRKAYVTEDNVKKKMISDWDGSHDKVKLAEKYGYKNKDSMEKAVSRFKILSRKGIKTREMIRWTDEKKNLLKTLYKSGKSVPEIAEKLGIPSKKIYDKVYYMKNASKEL